jgi:hypothetical protein
MDETQGQSEDENSEAGPSPFQEFKDFARRLFAVPKSEIDEQRAKDKRGPKSGNGPEPKTVVR